MNECECQVVVGESRERVVIEVTMASVVTVEGCLFDRTQVRYNDWLVIGSDTLRASSFCSIFPAIFPIEPNNRTRFTRSIKLFVIHAHFPILNHCNSLRHSSGTNFIGLR